MTFDLEDDSGTLVDFRVETTILQYEVIKLKYKFKYIFMIKHCLKLRRNICNNLKTNW